MTVTIFIAKKSSGKDYQERKDILSDAIDEIFWPIETVAMTPEESERKDSQVGNYVTDGEVTYGGYALPSDR